MGKRFNGFVLGATIGAAAAFLFAPKSGKENREMVKSLIDEYLPKEEYYEDDELSDVINSLNKRSDDLADHLKNAHEEVSDSDTIYQDMESADAAFEREMAAAKEASEDIIINMTDSDNSEG